MPLNTSKNSKIFQLTTLYKIYGPWLSIKFALIALKRYLINVLILKSYSQYGEDLIISKLLKNKKNIFYIDIGSNHPTKFNNTFRFYKSQNSGIIVEPNSQLVKLHQKIRPNDIALNIGVSNTNSSLTFYNLFPDVTSTFSEAEYKQQIKGGAKLLSITQVKTMTLRSVVAKYCPNQKIDLLSVDTEGNDLKVLQSHDWQRYRPHIICVETLTDNGVHEFLLRNDYRRVFQNAINSIYETIQS